MSTPMAAPRCLAEAQTGPLSTFATALVTTAVRAAVVTLPFSRITRFVWAVSNTRVATRAEVEHALRTVDAAARWLPFRVACLERSLAGVILLAARRRRAVWCLGVRQTPPIAMHAWLADAAGQPVGEPNTATTYRLMMTIPQPTGENAP